VAENFTLYARTCDALPDEQMRRLREAEKADEGLARKLLCRLEGGVGAGLGAGRTGRTARADRLLHARLPLRARTGGPLTGTGAVSSEAASEAAHAPGG
jgi:hypothetical protein